MQLLLCLSAVCIKLDFEELRNWDVLMWMVRKRGCKFCLLDWIKSNHWLSIIWRVARACTHADSKLALINLHAQFCEYSIKMHHNVKYCESGRISFVSEDKHLLYSKLERNFPNLSTNWNNNCLVIVTFWDRAQSATWKRRGVSTERKSVVSEQGL